MSFTDELGQGMGKPQWDTRIDPQGYENNTFSPILPPNS